MKSYLYPLILILSVSATLSSCGKTRGRNSGLEGEKPNGREYAVANRMADFPQLTKSTGHDFQVIAVIDSKELALPKLKASIPQAIGMLSLDTATVQYHGEYEANPLPKNSRTELPTQTLVYAIQDPNFPGLVALSVDRSFNLNSFQFRNPILVNHQLQDYCAEMPVPHKDLDKKVQILSQVSACNKDGVCSVKFRWPVFPNKHEDKFQPLPLSALKEVNPNISCARTSKYHYYQTQFFNEQVVLGLILTLESGARIRIKN
jgi:hypothetical protein